MKRKNLSLDEIRDMLAAYAMRSLDSSEEDELKSALNKLNPNELLLLEDYEELIGLLGEFVSPQVPPPSIKLSLMAKIEAELAAEKLKESFHHRPGTEEDWQPVFPGIRMRVLSENRIQKTRTVLLDFRAGSTLPQHVHKGREEVFVLYGTCTLNNQYLQQGDYLVAEPGSVHQSVTFDVDCRILAIIPEIEFAA
ncbi:MAG: cupin domain-containing protein [Calditrichia bacterium]